MEIQLLWFDSTNYTSFKRALENKQGRHDAIVAMSCLFVEDKRHDNEDYNDIVAGISYRSDIYVTTVS